MTVVVDVLVEPDHNNYYFNATWYSCILEMHAGAEEEEKEADGPELRHRREPTLVPVHHSGVTALPNHGRRAAFNAVYS